ncbi:maltokinase, partial [Streptomyces sp. SID4982]|nr:maltokinase [Streptomyces sp. SID4982]
MPKTITLSPPAATGADGLLASLGGLLREWLPRQRWFAGKDRPATDLSVLSVTELFPGCLHLLVNASHAPVPTPGGTPPPGDCYQLLLGLRERPAPSLERAFIGRAEQGPLAGFAVYDALHDPRCAHLLLERLRRPGKAGPLRFEADPDAEVPGGLAPRLLTSEQSNSSIVYGDAYILKLFRRIQPGVNPDLEVPQALAAQGCARVPAPVAWFCTTAPRPATLGVLQPFLPDAVDGWELALRALAQGGDFTAEASGLGAAMAEVHLALAGAFPAAGGDENEATAEA